MSAIRVGLIVLFPNLRLLLTLALYLYLGLPFLARIRIKDGCQTTAP
jgi:hypothetical protein